MSNEAKESRKQRALMRSLGRELYQTETSASRHARREARRLGAVAPAWALAGVADHADGVLRELPRLAARHDLPVSGGGHLIGWMFSATRHFLLDRGMDAERSYRGTLLGMRHGVDVVSLLKLVALRVGDMPLAEWCQSWLDVRQDLVARVENELGWFADHPVEAMAPVALLLPLRRSAAA